LSLRLRNECVRVCVFICVSSSASLNFGMMVFVFFKYICIFGAYYKGLCRANILLQNVRKGLLQKLSDMQTVSIFMR
jgi:hypothetical protein